MAAFRPFLELHRHAHRALLLAPEGILAAAHKTKQKHRQMLEIF
jgi:hypothetical protein